MTCTCSPIKQRKPFNHHHCHMSHPVTLCVSELMPCRVLDIRWSMVYHNLNGELQNFSLKSSKLRLVAMDSSEAPCCTCPAWHILRDVNLTHLLRTTPEHFGVCSKDELKFYQRKRLRISVLHNTLLSGGPCACNCLTSAANMIAHNNCGFAYMLPQNWATSSQVLTDAGLICNHKLF